MWAVVCAVAGLSVLMGMLSSRVWRDIEALSARLTLVERAQLDARLEQLRTQEQVAHVESVE